VTRRDGDIYVNLVGSSHGCASSIGAWLINLDEDKYNSFAQNKSKFYSEFAILADDVLNEPSKLTEDQR